MTVPNHIPAIVLVDDEPDILRMLAMFVRRICPAYALLPVARAADALTLVDERPVPLVITDYNMPGMNGLELTTAIKAAAPTTRVIMITGYPTPELERAARAQQVDVFLAKPFSLDQLEALVREALAGEDERDAAV
jgi:two-component system, response regulator, stage 0 sporulation protein F